ncbi:MAG: TetR family transcriptional regulator [Deltaproteobacteria bacterium]|nr:TetR family transcriptional regulator [Deltaproteobacteria bacterium]
MGQDKEEKRQIIRDAAAKLFVQKGFENTTTRDISSAAGISKGAPYYYFTSKEDLLFQILDETGAMGLQRIKEIEGNDISLKDKLSEILELYTTHYVLYRNEMKLFVNEQQSLTPEHKETLKEKQREYGRVFIRILDSLREQGQIVDYNTTVITFAFFGMANWIYRWYTPDGPVKIPELLDIFQHIFTKGIYVDRQEK